MYNVDPVASVRYSWCTMCILSRYSLMYNMYPIKIIPDVLPPLPLNAPHRRLPSCWLPARAFHLLFTGSWGSDPLFSFVSLSFFLSFFHSSFLPFLLSIPTTQFQLNSNNYIYRIDGELLQFFFCFGTGTRQCCLLTSKHINVKDEPTIIIFALL